MPDEVTQRNKSLVWDFWQQLDVASPADLRAVAASALAEDVAWTGFHPFNELSGRAAVVDGWWQPLRAAFPDVRRETYILLGGSFEGKEWVSATGCFVGTFAADWAGIPATGQPTSIRWGEFCAIRDGKIVEDYLLLDLVDVMRQAGHRVFPPAPAEDYWPRPFGEDGALLSPQDDVESLRSLHLVEAMIGGLGKFDGADVGKMNQTTFWSQQMHWYGPCGIGSSRDRKEYERNHQTPFLTAFPDRKGFTHPDGGRTRRASPRATSWLRPAGRACGRRTWASISAPPPPGGGSACAWPTGGAATVICSCRTGCSSTCPTCSCRWGWTCLAVAAERNRGEGTFRREVGLRRPGPSPQGTPGRRPLAAISIAQYSGGNLDPTQCHRSHRQRHQQTDEPGAEKRQGMRGFDADYVDIVDYIVRCTHKIWEEKQVGLIYTHYGHNALIHGTRGDSYGIEAVVAGTVQTLAMFPDRRLFADDVIWSGDDEQGYYTSHRITSTAHHSGCGVYGAPTGRKLRYRVIADCVVRENRIAEEWLVRDELSIVRQLGLDEADPVKGIAEGLGCAARSGGRGPGRS